MDAVTALVKRLHTEGFPPKAIVKASGLSSGEVFYHLNVLGVTKRAMHRPRAVTPWEDAFLLGSLLGDGHIRYRHVGRGAPHFAITHAEKQQAYLSWKVDQLGDLFFEPSYVVSEDADGHRSVHATSRCCSLLAEYHVLFYGTGTRKTINPDILRRVEHHEFHDVVMAVWFGDDGYRTSGNGKSLGYVLGGLTEDGYEQTREWFDRIGYPAVLHKHGKNDTYRYLLLRVEAAHRLRDAIGAYLPPSMQYKLDIGPPRKIRRSRISKAV